MGVTGIRPAGGECSSCSFFHNGIDDEISSHRVPHSNRIQLPEIKYYLSSVLIRENNVLRIPVVFWILTRQACLYTRAVCVDLLFSTKIIGCSATMQHAIPVLMNLTCNPAVGHPRVEPYHT